MIEVRIKQFLSKTSTRNKIAGAKTFTKQWEEIYIQWGQGAGLREPITARIEQMACWETTRTPSPGKDQDGMARPCTASLQAAQCRVPLAPCKGCSRGCTSERGRERQRTAAGLSVARCLLGGTGPVSGNGKKGQRVIGWKSRGYILGFHWLGVTCLLREVWVCGLMGSLVLYAVAAVCGV